MTQVDDQTLEELANRHAVFAKTAEEGTQRRALHADTAKALFAILEERKAARQQSSGSGLRENEKTDVPEVPNDHQVAAVQKPRKPKVLSPWNARRWTVQPEEEFAVPVSRQVRTR
jgi:hypothetical protein